MSASWVAMHESAAVRLPARGWSLELPLLAHVRELDALALVAEAQRLPPAVHAEVLRHALGTHPATNSGLAKVGLRAGTHSQRDEGWWYIPWAVGRP